MTHLYGISKSPDVSDIVHSVEALTSCDTEHGPGRCDVDEYSLDPFPGPNFTARAWGKVIHHEDGQVVMDELPWEA